MSTQVSSWDIMYTRFGVWSQVTSDEFRPLQRSCSSPMSLIRFIYVFFLAISFYKVSHFKPGLPQRAFRVHWTPAHIQRLILSRHSPSRGFMHALIIYWVRATHMISVTPVEVTNLCPNAVSQFSRFEFDWPSMTFGIKTFKKSRDLLIIWFIGIPNLGFTRITLLEIFCLKVLRYDLFEVQVTFDLHHKELRKRTIYLLK